MIQSLLMGTHSNPTNCSLWLSHILHCLGLNIFIDRLWRNHLSPGLSAVFSWHYYCSFYLMKYLLFAVCFVSGPANLLGILFWAQCRPQGRHEPTFLLWRSISFICASFNGYHRSIVETWSFGSFRHGKDRVFHFFRFIAPSSLLIIGWWLFLINFFCSFSTRCLFTQMHSFYDFVLGSMLWLPFGSHGD